MHNYAGISTCSAEVIFRTTDHSVVLAFTKLINSRQVTVDYENFICEIFHFLIYSVG